MEKCSNCQVELTTGLFGNKKGNCDGCDKPFCKKCCKDDNVAKECDNCGYRSCAACFVNHKCEEEDEEKSVDEGVDIVDSTKGLSFDQMFRLFLIKWYEINVTSSSYTDEEIIKEVKRT